MPARRRLARLTLALLLGALTAASGCALACNYPDAAGPIYLHTGPTTTVERRDLQVLTYNIKYGRGIDRVVALLAAGGAVERPDILVLQEVDAPGVEHIARSLGMNSVYVPAAIHPASPRDFGVAILSPWPLEGARKIVLPHQHRFRKMKRSAVVATLATPLGAVRVYGVHLETPFGLSGRRRREQIATIVHDAGAWSGPVVIAGDFNAKATARAAVASGYAWLTRDVGGTVGRFSFDHILVRGLCASGQPTSGKITRARGISDHLPVWARTRACMPGIDTSP